MIWHFNLDPVAFEFLGVSVYWYGICFASGIMLSTFLLERDKDFIAVVPTTQLRDRFLTLLVVSLLLGAKFGYLALYTSMSAWSEHLVSPRGFSFHGALVGALSFLVMWSKCYKISLYNLMDLAAYYTPIGLFFGRVGNFLNSELWGRPTYSEHFGVIFERTDRLLIPRHPSQLYEAFGEGFCLFLLMFFTRRYSRKKGQLSAHFLLGYGVVRFVIESWRQPDSHLGFVLRFPGILSIGLSFFIFSYQSVRLINAKKPIFLSLVSTCLVMLLCGLTGSPFNEPWLLTMGQLLCLGMIIGGLSIQIRQLS